jgi:Asp-tRNA(Asn)/Glu-tRNA(Gln) amidotransferase A subunit family amidase
VVAALGADGGGSIRITAAFTGLVGLKPTRGRVIDEGGFAAISDFISAGPMAWRVDDIWRIFDVLATEPAEKNPARMFNIGYVARPEDRPIDEHVHFWMTRAVVILTGMGHQVTEFDLDLSRWKSAFGPLVLGEEFSARGHLLDDQPDLLTDYERITLEAGRDMNSQRVADCRVIVEDQMKEVERALDEYDIIATPATAVPAHLLGQRPEEMGSGSTNCGVPTRSPRRSTCLAIQQSLYRSEWSTINCRLRSSWSGQWTVRDS